MVQTTTIHLSLNSLALLLRIHQFLNNKLDFNHYFGQYLGNTIFKKIIHYNTFNDLFKKILDTKTELSNNDIYKNIINSLTPQYHKILKLSIASAINNSQDIKNIQEDYKSLISRLSHENLTEKQLRKHIDSFVSFSINKYLNSNLNNLLDDIDIINSNQSDILNKSKKYSGTVYSGQRITKAYRHFYKIGKIITLSSNMSTSSVRDVAMGYASQKINSSVFLTPVVFEIQLTGKNGIDISGFSTFNSEHEILLLPGTHLKVKSIETIALDKNTYAPLIKLEEVGNTPQALRSWVPQDPNSPKNYPTKFY